MAKTKAPAQESKYNLPTKVTLKEWQFNRLHESFMEAATYWANSRPGSYYSDKKSAEALAYLHVLHLVMMEAVPEEVWSSVCDEYNAILFSPRKEEPRENKR